MKSKKFCFVVLICVAATSSLHGAAITLKAGGDAGGTSSFNAALNWDPAVAPSAGNSYSVSVNFLRTPADGENHVFAGDSLTLNTGGAIIHKGTALTNTYTIANFVLNGGFVRSGAAFNNTLALAGGLTVNGTGSYFLADQSPFIIGSVTTGTGDLTIQGGYPVTFTAANTFTGKLTLSQTGAGTTLAENSHWKFVVGANGVNNTITGTGVVTLNGIFDIDLSAASATIGHQWKLVDVGTLAETFGPTFAIAGFTENEGIWTSADGRYQFLEINGTLTAIRADSDGDGLPDVWEIAHFGNLDAGPNDHSDEDYSNNLAEYLAGTDPNDASDYPDTDGDGLDDGWELLYFNNLAQGADGDPDGDFVSNIDEFKAGTIPTNANSYPDTDFDGINDGWEVHHFGSIAACDPDLDADGDLFTNLEEFQANTDPHVQISSPDIDGDGIADGWEVKYFRVGNESLDAAIARQGATGDPDNDHISNLLEFKAGTHPLDAGSGDPTLGYWRFEEMLAGEVPSGGNGAYAFPTSITDSAPYGNPMMAWADYSRPNYVALVPAPVVPATGAANTASLHFLRNGNDPRYFIESVFTSPANLLAAGQGFLRTYTLPEFTVELSFNTPLTGVWQVPVCKVGNPVGGQPPFSLKVDTTNKLRAGMVDGSGVVREIISATTIATGSWYSAAVTATATELKLWLKGPADAGYRLEGQLAISGAWYVPAAGPLDTIWNIGGGQWNGTAADPFQGEIDEVRLSTVALAPEKFLFHTVATTGAYTEWVATRITDATRRLETDDADGDGTSNLTEFRLGLDPVNGASRFAAAQAADGTMSWPSTTGVSFSIQRSDTMAAGSWAKIATVPGTAGTATFKDLTPPTGKAFYRILLEP